MIEKKTQITGSITTVDTVTIDIYPDVLIKNAIPFMSTKDVLTVMYRLLEQKFREADPSLAKLDICWYRKCWELEDGFDYHKGLPMTKDIRKFNQFELDSLLVLEAIKGVLED